MEIYRTKSLKKAMRVTEDIRRAPDCFAAVERHNGEFEVRSYHNCEFDLYMSDRRTRRPSSLSTYRKPNFAKAGGLHSLLSCLGMAR